MRRRLTRGFRHCVGFSVTRCNAPHRNSVGMPPTQVKNTTQLAEYRRHAAGCRKLLRYIDCFRDVFVDCKTLTGALRCGRESSRTVMMETTL